MGEAFVELPKDEADALLDKRKEEIQQEMEEIGNEIDSIKKTLAELKVKLYGKFKTSINLEED
jgi:chaperonin cofactor prefoldin